MINLAGLSAVYPGYQQAENTQATTEQNQAAAREAAIKLLGQQVLGRAFAGGQQSPSQPLAPAPGQPSTPSNPAPAAPPPVQGQGGAGPSAAPPPAAPVPGAAPTGLPEISLQGLTQRILQTSPQVAQHPEILMAALERASPILDRQSKEDLAELRKQMATERLAQTGELARARIDALKAAEEGRNTRAEDRNARTDRRLDQADVREQRLAAASQVRQDQGWTRLQMQRENLERQIQQGGDRQALSQWRAVVDAQHKRATEIIQANGVMSGLKPDAVKDLLAEQKRVYEESIAAMRGKMETPKAAPAAPAQPSAAPAAAPAASPVKVQTPAEAAKLAPGTKYVTPDGQEYTR